MRKKVIPSLLFLVFFMTSLNAYEKAPVAVSPGSEEDVAVVAQSCPTFSWTAVDWAEGYRVAVFEAVGSEVLAYEEMEALSPQVIRKEIKGRASSWTPSSDERLAVGREYVWYIQALDAYGQGIWSEGRLFKVDVAINLEGVEGKVRKRLLEQGMSEEVIDGVLEDMKSGVRDVIAYGVNTKGSLDSTQDRMSIQDLEGEETNNTFFGLNAGANLLSGGLYNAFFGNSSGRWNYTGDNNSFVGWEAGYSTQTGDDNTFIGYRAGRSNLASDNTFVGSDAGYSNTLGTSNTFMGYYAGRGNTTGDNNTFNGFNAGYSSTTGFNNTFLGAYSGLNNTTGEKNTFIGSYAGHDNTIGDDNTFIGVFAGRKNIEGQYNTFIGSAAGFNNTTGNWNTIFGTEAGYSNTTGGGNTIFGAEAGSSNTTGGGNTFIGDAAGYSNTEGTGNVFLGHYAGFDETGSYKLYIDSSDTSSPLIWGDFSSNIVAINGKFGVGTKTPGYPMELERTGTNASIIVDRTDGAMNYINATAGYANFGSVRSHPLRLVVNGLWTLRLDSDNSLTMKNGATCTAGGEWQNASSQELKENIRDLTAEEAEEALKGLAPVRFNYKADQEDESLGFIAEDVPDLVATKDRKGLSPMDVVAVLTKVLQEQQEAISELREEIAELKRKAKQ